VSRFTVDVFTSMWPSMIFFPASSNRTASREVNMIGEDCDTVFCHEYVHFSKSDLLYVHGVSQNNVFVKKSVLCPREGETLKNEHKKWLIHC
jgi:hypothetical protein